MPWALWLPWCLWLLGATQSQAVPADAEVRVIGEVDVLGTGNIRVGTALTLHKDSVHFKLGRALYRTMQMFTDWLNNKRGGIFLQGHHRSMEIKLIDDHGANSGVLEATKRLLDEGIQLFLGPIGDSLTRTAAEEVDRRGGTMVAPTGLARNIFNGKPQVFGIESPAGLALPSAFAQVAAAAAPPRSVAYFAQDTFTWTEVCSHVSDLAASYGMTFLSGINVTRHQAVDAVDFLLTQQPELIVGCSPGGQGSLCENFLFEAERRNLNSKATILTNCIDDDAFNRLGDRARWVISTVSWTDTMPFASAPGFGSWTPSIFNDAYERYFLEDASPEAAALWGALCSIVAAIERADSTDPALVAAQLRSGYLETIYGNISFNQDGQSRLDWSVTQIPQLYTVPFRISPHKEMDLYYPTPAWADRKCNNNDRPAGAQLGYDSKFGYDANGVCGLCPEIAEYDTSVHRRVCKTCAVNHTLVDDLSTNTSYCQQPCAPGHSGQDCSPCPAGQFEVSGTCQSCLMGRFSYTSGSTACTECAVGTFAGARGRSICDPCKPGTSVSVTGAIQCVTCDFGKNASHYGMTECGLCKRGWVASSEGMSHCDPCPAGTRSLWGSRSCELCPVNSHQPNAGNDTCFADSRGQFSARLGTTVPENDRGYWHRGGGQMEFCQFDPGACEENETCATGHTGRQCIVCLPGYARSKMACFECPHRVLNIAMTSIVAVLAVVAALLGSRFVLSSVGRAQDTIVIVLCKQLLNHCVTMSICYTVLITLFRENRLFLKEDALWLAESFAAPLNFFDGCIPSETMVWSVTCLFQPFVDFAMVNRLQTAEHTYFFDASLAADRDTLRARQMYTEIIYITFWLVWPVCFIIICNLIGFSMLYSVLSRNKEFYSNAFQFYKEVKDQTFKKVERKYIESRRRAYIDAYYARINGIWSPVQHVLRMYASRSQQRRFVDKKLYFEESSILKTTIFFVTYAPVGRALIRPIRCMKLGDSAAGSEESLIYSASAVSCTADHPLLWIATAFAFIWLLCIPARNYYKLWRAHTRLHLPNSLREFGFLTGGYKFDCWWWEPVIFMRKALCFAMEAMPFISERERIMGFLVLSICFFVLEFSLSPYDDRCNGLFHKLELQQLALFVFTVLCLQLLDELLVTDSDYVGTVCIAMAAILTLFHVIYMGCICYSILVNVIDLIVKTFEQPWLRDKPVVKLLMKYLTAINQSRMRDSPYIAYDPLYGWVTICGSHGDNAVPPYIPKGSMAEKYQDNRPKLSEAPRTPEIPGDTDKLLNMVEVATCWQRLELQRILSMSLSHIAASHESGPVFSLSITEFVIRAAFVLDKSNRSPIVDAHLGPEEFDRHVWAKALRENDPLKLKLHGAKEKDPSKQKETQGEGRGSAYGASGQDRLPGSQEERGLNNADDEEVNETPARMGDLDMDDNPDERLYTTKALCMEEDLPKAFSDARGATLGDAHGATGQDRLSGSPGSPKENGLSKAEEEKVNRIKHKRYKALVHDMFTPSTFRRGLTLPKLQFALMQLHSLPRDDLVYWLDQFEELWLHEKAATNSELRRMGLQLKNASEESAITSAKPKKAQMLAASNWEEIMTCDIGIQVQAPLARSSINVTKDLALAAKDETPDPSLKVALRWLYLVMEFRNTVSLSSLRKAMRPVDRRRNRILKELKHVQEETEREERRLLELQGGATPVAAAPSQTPFLSPPSETPGRGSTTQPSDLSREATEEEAL